MRFLLPLIILGFTCCGPAEPTPVAEVKTVSGNLRYQEDARTLQAELVLPDSTERPPTFLGDPMRPLRGFPARRFRLERVQDLPGDIRFSVTEQGAVANFSFPFHRVYIDSLPDTLRRTEAANFAVGDRGMTEEESLLLFFEPADRSNPKRILVTGPTDSGIVSLPTSAINDISPGEYSVYFVKQQLYKDRHKNLRVSVQAEYFTRSQPLTVE
ncbi:hypothetical protein GGR28_000115 [Lewinella aquimaris]|uniref:Uncharacterized protein n=1 Tax=Neolewinella aquimaris TaxID=1835722 RepID=A0A840DWF4_9BACT|nr:hypothetical protein [Neolewinella aquimaris]MBB4077514.1 hypothetical protein [Neolewinella aquimaris]